MSYENDRNDEYRSGSRRKAGYEDREEESTYRDGTDAYGSSDHRGVPGGYDAPTHRGVGDYGDASHSRGEGRRQPESDAYRGSGGASFERSDRDRDTYQQGSGGASYERADKNTSSGYDNNARSGGYGRDTSDTSSYSRNQQEVPEMHFPASEAKAEPNPFLEPAKALAGDTTNFAKDGAKKTVENVLHKVEELIGHGGDKGPRSGSAY